MSSDRHKSQGERANRRAHSAGNGTRNGGPREASATFVRAHLSAEALFRDLVDNCPDLVLCVAPDGQMLYANTAALAALGYTADALEELDFTDLLAEESRAEYGEWTDELKAGKTVGPVELNLCDAHDERLTVEGKLNCRFEEAEPAWFRIVLRDLRDEADIVEPEPKEAGEAAVPRPRILVVEDDDISARMLSRLLERGGYATDRVATGAEALERLANERYDAMTLDLALPDKDGVDLLHQIRTSEETADLPVVVVSASADEARQRLTGDVANVADWLNKPFGHDSLRSALTRAVKVGEGRLPRVLHVEDDDEFSVHVRDTLADVADTERACTLAEARKKLKENEDYDLVLLDLTLPDGLGAELLPFLNRPRGRSVPVILVSSSEATNALAAHVADTLNKSDTNQQQMLDTIRAHLRR